VGKGGTPESERASRRFDSWKEIAAYFGRDVRTVRRWERNEALPVYRHFHRSHASVYAFQQELDDWHERRTAPLGTATARLWESPAPVLLIIGITSLLALTGWGFGLIPAALLSGSVEPVQSGPLQSAEAKALRWLGDAEVRQPYLLARHLLDRRGEVREPARKYLEATIERAPDFAEAHALLGEAYLRQALFEPSRRAEAWLSAEAAVKRALMLDKDLATAHAIFSRILLLRDWNWAAAESESLRAIQLDPEAPDARASYALYLRSVGRLAEAIVERGRAQRADPLNPQWLVFLGDEYLFARRYHDAIVAYERALELERDYRPAVASLADGWERVGRHGDAAEWQWRSLILRGQKNLAAAFDEVRQREGPRAAIEWLDRWNLSKFQGDPSAHLWDLAFTHARLGNREAALVFLQRAYDQRDPGMLQARIDPDLDSLRSDDRFSSLLQRIAPR
jgi:tetratricopeptide (TPR) repeat protein